MIPTTPQILAISVYVEQNDSGGQFLQKGRLLGPYGQGGYDLLRSFERLLQPGGACVI